jgi:hypothetical protein
MDDDEEEDDEYNDDNEDSGNGESWRNCIVDKSRYYEDTQSIILEVRLDTSAVNWRIIWTFKKQVQTTTTL